MEHRAELTELAEKIFVALASNPDTMDAYGHVLADAAFKSAKAFLIARDAMLTQPE